MRIHVGAEVQQSLRPNSFDHESSRLILSVGFSKPRPLVLLVQRTTALRPTRNILAHEVGRWQNPCQDYKGLGHRVVGEAC